MYKIFNLFGIPVYLNKFFVYFLGSYFLLNSIMNGFWSSLFTFSFIFIMYLSVMLHEFGHALAALWFKYKPKSIELTYWGGVTYLPNINKAHKHILISLAGPLVNAIIFMICFLIKSDNELLNNAWRMNLMLCIFNMLPILPLDGGRILHSILWAYFNNKIKAKKPTIITSIICSIICVLAIFTLVLLGKIIIISALLLLIMFAYFLFINIGNLNVRTKTV